MEGIFWLVVVVVMAVIEIITLGLTTIWFAGGALIAFFACLLGAGLPVQIALFLIVSLVLLIFTRPFAMRFINTNRIRTNAESLVGQKAVVLQEINNLKAEGTASINGMEWTARAADNSIIPEGTTVVIEEIKGVKLVVKPE